MAYENILERISLEAAADLSSSQYFFVKVDSNGKAALAGANDQAVGILQNKPASGETAEIAVFGVSKLVASAEITQGARLSATAAGKAVTATGTSVSDATATGVRGTPGNAIALEAASADGDIIAALIIHGGSEVTAVAT